ncbi:hypothetical protein DUQ06_04130 [Salmonella enterica subsp. diarizonae]|nr:hypothetical protein [Salmonella enterica subsp. diarizonae]EAS3779822.1 hypothetical protein [Salmonella enterica]ECC3890310.1 hypothetical protein [Salmonella enterica subsp. diarizonae]ECC9618678.1 hypothetical protein [Salmonella enterica subsp. diarizonae]ECG0796883.1 hypothetical protein [Salmonella enterica subsp. diarizonae]
MTEAFSPAGTVNDVNSQDHFPGIAQMRQLADLIVCHAHDMTEGVVRTAVHHLFIRKGQNGIAGTLTDERMESVIFIHTHFSPEAETTRKTGNRVRMVGNSPTRRENIMRQ